MFAGGLRFEPSPRAANNVGPLTWATDSDELEKLQYWCQLSFRSTDLRVDNAIRTASENDIQCFRTMAGNLGGSIVITMVDARPLVKAGAIVKSKNGGVNVMSDLSHVDLQIGTQFVPQAIVEGRVHQVVVCQIALGRTALPDDGKRNLFPGSATSILVEGSPPLQVDEQSKFSKRKSANIPERAAEWRQTYQVKDASQVLPCYLVDISQNKKKPELGQVVCDDCLKSRASVYCINEDAHFCSECDERHHRRNEFFARHNRVTMDKSPKRFGKCFHHQDQLVDSVCMDCRKVLCKFCVTSGPHAGEKYKKHEVVSTLQVMEAANKGDVDMLQEYKKKARHEMVTHQRFKKDATASFDEIRQDLDVVLGNLLGLHSRVQTRKVECLQSIRRQVLATNGWEQWLEGYLAHCRLALPTSDYLVACQRHKYLVRALLSNPANEVAPYNAAKDFGALGTIPSWITEVQCLEGRLEVSLAPLPNDIDEPTHLAMLKGLRGPSSVDNIEGLVPSQFQLDYQGNAGFRPEETTDSLSAVGHHLIETRAELPFEPLSNNAQPLSSCNISFPQFGASFLAPAVGLRPGTVNHSSRTVLPSSVALPQGNFSDQIELARGFDGYVSQAFAYLEDAERRIERTRATNLPLGRSPQYWEKRATRAELAEPISPQHVWQTGQHPVQNPGSQFGEPVTGTICDASSPNRVAGAASSPGGIGSNQASLKTATEVLLFLRGGAELVDGPPGPFGLAWVLMTCCPFAERAHFLSDVLNVVSALGETTSEFLRNMVEMDVQSVQTPTLLAAAHSNTTLICQILLDILFRGGFTWPELEDFNRAVESTTSTSQLTGHNLIGSLISTLSNRPNPLPPPTLAICNYLYSAAETRFGVSAAHNAVVMLVTARIITPTILNEAQKARSAISERILHVSRLFQRVAHYAHHEEITAAASGTDGVVPQDLEHVLLLVASMRDLVSHILSKPPPTTLQLGVEPADAETAANSILQACQRWLSGDEFGGRRGNQAQNPNLERVRPLLQHVSQIGQPAAQRFMP